MDQGELGSVPVQMRFCNINNNILKKQYTSPCPLLNKVEGY